eukprot:m51a1_g14175 hypothetical protein (3303) ;mRNA; f:29594-45724
MSGNLSGWPFRWLQEYLSGVRDDNAVARREMDAAAPLLGQLGLFSAPTASTAAQFKAEQISPRTRACTALLSELLAVDEMACLRVVRSSVAQSAWFGAHGDQAASEQLTPEEARDLARFFRAERLASLQCVCLILQLSSGGDTAGMGGYTKRLRDGSLQGSTPALSERIFAVLQSLLCARVEPTARALAVEGSDAWQESLLAEQKALLQCLFIAVYTKTPAPKTVALMAGEFDRALYGCLQPSLSAAVRERRRDDTTAIERLCVLVVLLSFDFEALLVLKSGEAETHPLYDPQDHWGPMVEVQNELAKKAWGVRCKGAPLALHGVLQLGWASFAMIINGCSGKQIFEWSESVALANRMGAAPLEWARVALSELSRQSPSFVTGYKGTIKDLLGALLCVGDVYTLPGFMPLYEECFRDQPELCCQWWYRDCEKASLSMPFRLLRGKFPMEFAPFISLLAALSTGEYCSQRCIEQLNDVREVCVPLTSWEHIAATDGEEMPTTIATTAATMNYGYIVVPAGCRGQVVNGGTAVSYTLPAGYSAWSLIRNVIAFFIRNPESCRQSIEDARNIAAVVSLIHVLASASPERALQVAQYLEPASPSKIVDTLCSIASRCTDTVDNYDLCSKLFLCIKCYVPVFPDSIFYACQRESIIPTRDNTYLVHSYLLNKVEVQLGRYSVTSSYVDLVCSLTTYLLSWRVKFPADDILPLIAYIKSTVFCCLDGWRFQHVLDKWVVARKVLSLFDIVLEDALHNPEATGDTPKYNLTSTQEMLVTSIQFDAGVIRSLLTIVSIGGAQIDALMRTDRASAEALNQLIGSALKVLLSVLKLTPPDKETLLKKSLLQNAGSGNFVLVTLSYIRHCFGSLPILGSQLLSALCSIARPQPILGFIGDAGAASLIKSIRDMLREDSGSPSSQVTQSALPSCLRLLSSALTAQQTGFANKLLSAQGGLPQHLVSVVTESSAQGPASLIVGEIMRLLVNLWRSAPDQMLSPLREASPNFWQTVVAHAQRKYDSCAGDPVTLRLKASALELLSCELYSKIAANRNAGSAAGSSPVEAAVASFGSAEQLAEWTALIGAVPTHVEANRAALSAAAALGVDLKLCSRVNSEADSSLDYEYDAEYLHQKLPELLEQQRDARMADGADDGARTFRDSRAALEDAVATLNREIHRILAHEAVTKSWCFLMSVATPSGALLPRKEDIRACIRQIAKNCLPEDNHENVAATAVDFGVPSLLLLLSRRLVSLLAAAKDAEDESCLVSVCEALCSCLKPRLGQTGPAADNRDALLAIQAMFIARSRGAACVFTERLLPDMADTLRILQRRESAALAAVLVGTAWRASTGAGPNVTLVRLRALARALVKALDYALHRTGAGVSIEDENKDVRLASSVLHAIAAIACSAESAEVLAQEGLIGLLCDTGLPYYSAITPPYTATGMRNEWHSVWCQLLRLAARMCECLRFRADLCARVTDFASVHAWRLCAAITIASPDTDAAASAAASATAMSDAEAPSITLAALDESLAAVSLLVQLRSRPDTWELADGELARQLDLALGQLVQSTSAPLMSAAPATAVAVQEKATDAAAFQATAKLRMREVLRMTLSALLRDSISRPVFRATLQSGPGYDPSLGDLMYCLRALRSCRERERDRTQQEADCAALEQCASLAVCSVIASRRHGSAARELDKNLEQLTRAMDQTADAATQSVESNAAGPLSPLHTTVFSGAHHDNPHYWSDTTVDQRRVRMLLSVCWFDCNCRVDDVPPGKYVAAWRLYLDRAGGFQGRDPIAVRLCPEGQGAPAAEAQLDVANSSTQWALAVFPEVLRVEQRGALVAEMALRSGNWKSGFGVAEFALVPVAWSPDTHRLYPREFRDAVRALLLVNRRLGLATPDVVLLVCESWVDVKAGLRSLHLLTDVRTFNCNCAIDDVPPGKYVAVWRLFLDSVSGFEHSDPITDGYIQWELAVFPEVFKVEQRSAVVAEMEQRSDNWKSGFGVSEFALLPASWSPDTHRMHSKEFRDAEAVSEQGYLAEGLSKVELAKRLRRAHEHLARVAQEDGEAKAALRTLAADLATTAAATKDRDARLLCACAMADVIRIYAPDSPYDDDQLQDIFKLWIEQLSKVGDEMDPSFTLRFYLLEKLAMVRAFILLLEISPALVNELFVTFYSVVGEDVPSNVLSLMLEIAQTCVTESQENASPMFETVLLPLTPPGNHNNPAAASFSADLIQRCPARFQTILATLYTKALEVASEPVDADEAPGAAMGLTLAKMHDVIEEVNRIDTKRTLLALVLPLMEAELRSENDKLRKDAVLMLARIFAEKDSKLHTEYRPLFTTFLSRFNDKSQALRATMVAFGESFVSTHMDDDTVTPPICKEVVNRLRDPDDSVRKKAVAAVLTLWKAGAEAAKLMDQSTLLEVSERLRDKKDTVRAEAVKALGELYARSRSRRPNTDIASRVLTCYVIGPEEDKYRAERALDKFLLQQLDPEDYDDEAEEQRAKQLAVLVKGIDERALRCLERLLEARKALQDDVAALVARRAENAPKEELHRRIDAVCKRLPVPGAKEALRKMHESKDTKPFKALAVLSRPESTVAEVLTAREFCLRAGRESALAVLANRLAQTVVTPGAVAELLEEGGPCTMFVNTCAKLYPAVVASQSADLLRLAEDGDKDAVLALSALVYVADKGLLESGAKLRKIMEKFCTSAKRLVEDLDKDSDNTASLLQALGRIAEEKPAAIEPQAETLASFVVDTLFKEERQGKKGEVLAVAQGYGMKAIVRYLSACEDPQGERATSLFQTVVRYATREAQMLRSDRSEAEMQRAALCGLVSLASKRHYDAAITIEVLQAVATALLDRDTRTRDKIAGKLYKGLVAVRLPVRYLAVLAIRAADTRKDVAPLLKVHLANCVAQRRECVKQLPQLLGEAQPGPSKFNLLPEYALPYLLSLLAHLPETKTKDEPRDDEQHEGAAAEGEVEEGTAAAGTAPPAAAAKQEHRVALRALAGLLAPLVQCQDAPFAFLKELLEWARNTIDARRPQRTEALRTVCDIARAMIRKETEQRSWVEAKVAPDGLFLPKDCFCAPDSGDAVPTEASAAPDDLIEVPRIAPVTTPKRTPVKRRRPEPKAGKAGEKTLRQTKLTSSPSGAVRVETPSRVMPSRGVKKPVEYRDHDENEPMQPPTSPKGAEPSAKPSKRSPKKQRKEEDEGQESSEERQAEEDEMDESPEESPKKKQKRKAATTKRAKTKKQSESEEEEESQEEEEDETPKKKRAAGKRAQVKKAPESDEDEEDGDEESKGSDEEEPPKKRRAPAKRKTPVAKRAKRNAK